MSEEIKKDAYAVGTIFISSDGQWHVSYIGFHDDKKVLKYGKHQLHGSSINKLLHKVSTGLKKAEPRLLSEVSLLEETKAYEQSKNTETPVESTESAQTDSV